MHPFVYDEELKWGIQGYLLCLLANRLMLQLEPFGCKRARASVVMGVTLAQIFFKPEKNLEFFRLKNLCHR